MADAMVKKASSSVFPLSVEDDNTKPPQVVVTVEDGMKKKPTPPPLPVFVDTAKKLLRVPSSLSVACLLALFVALVLAIGAADSLIKSPCDPADYSRWCIELTDVAGTKVAALQRGQLWVSGVQAVAAFLGLLLAGRRSSRGRALGFIALTVGAVNLCMRAVVASIFIAAAPGNHSLKVRDIEHAVLFAALDLIGFIILVLGDDE